MPLLYQCSYTIIVYTRPPSKGCLKYRNALCLWGRATVVPCNSATADLTSTDNAGVRVSRNPSNTEAACFSGYLVLLSVVVLAFVVILFCLWWRF